MPVDPIAPSPITLRPCTPSDADLLALVAAATFLDTFAGIHPGDAILEHCRRHHTPEAYAHYLALPTTRAWFAETAPIPAAVGYLLLTAPDLPDLATTPTDVELKRIYLLSRFHGGGAGQLLMDQAIAGARAMGAQRLLLGVFAQNRRALRFYERNGFTPIATRTFQLGPILCDDLILSRPL
jgi:ribosomal protein S18 acetylase RimI-like enzyme